MPLISVIIPAYNAEKTIAATIHSVLKQSFRNLEIIVIDDGSTDNTRNVVASLADTRLKCFSYPNAQQAVSRNRGLSHATGEYIAFLDADDLWTANKLEAQLQALQTNPAAAVAYSWCDWIDENGNFLRQGGYKTLNGNIYRQLLLGNILENGSNPLIRRQALETVGGFDASLTPAEDWDIYIRLAARYEFVCVSLAQVLYRVSASSMSANLASLEIACCGVITKAFTEAPEALQSLKQPSLGNVYKYLTFKALEGIPKRNNAPIVARYFAKAIQYDSRLLKARVSLKVMLLICAMSVLSSKQMLSLLHQINLTPLLGYIYSEI